MLPDRRYAEWRLAKEQRIPIAFWGIAVAIIVSLAVIVPSPRIATCAFLFIGGLAGRRATSFLTRRRLRSLHDDPEGGQIPVVLRLRREVTYGYDEGLVSVVDGWLVYEGLRCSFSVRASDVGDLQVDSAKLVLPFEGPAGQHRISLEPADLFPFCGELANWRKDPAPEGTPLLPPVEPQSSAIYLSRIWIWLALAVALTGGLLSFSGLLISGQQMVAILLVLAGIGTVIYGSYVREGMNRLAGNLPFRRRLLSSPFGVVASQTNEVVPKALP